VNVRRGCGNTRIERRDTTVALEECDGITVDRARGRVVARRGVRRVRAVRTDLPFVTDATERA
jgi:hypothetical protein